jgi:hypothetical protein
LRSTHPREKVQQKTRKKANIRRCEWCGLAVALARQTHRTAMLLAVLLAFVVVQNLGCLSALKNECHTTPIHFSGL